MNCSWCQKELIRNLSIQEIFFPWIITEEKCSQCIKKITWLDEPCCPTCKKMGEISICIECQRWQKLYPAYNFRHHALFQYSEGFKEWMYQFKFLGDYHLKRVFASEVSGFFKHQSALVIPIPLTEKRLLERGFNQVEAILEAADVSMCRYLIRNQHLTPQSEKNRQERLAMPQPFCGTPEALKIQNQKVILVDDVYTTGRTLFHAAEVLLSYGPKEIQTFTLAR